MNMKREGFMFRVHWHEHVKGKVSCSQFIDMNMTKERFLTDWSSKRDAPSPGIYSTVTRVHPTHTHIYIYISPSSMSC